MELNLSNENAVFRDEVGGFVAEDYPAEISLRASELRPREVNK
jgi:hypothetical protein